MSLHDLAMLRADARGMDAQGRHHVATLLAQQPPAGSLLVSTCYRVELSGDRASIAHAASRPGMTGLERIEGPDVAVHLLRVAVGLDSAIVGEDQVLHQLRSAVGASRGRGPLPPHLDRLADIALRLGRRARSWLPAGRPSLADLALDRVRAGSHPPSGRPVLVVGAGTMGALAARAVRARGLPLLVASRTPERAAHLAEVWHGRAVALDPGASVDALEGIVVALAGPWRISSALSGRLAGTAGWLVDLSAPPACDAALAGALGPRHLSIDDLVSLDGEHDPGPLRGRLEELVEEGMAELHGWAAAAADRAAAGALARQAADARVAELAALWREVAGLAPEERAAIERMTERLTRRLLRAPMERLGQDGDGRYQRAARDLFGL